MTQAPSTLVVRDATGEVLRTTLTGEKKVIGRVAESDIRLDHGMVSRKHAEIWKDEQGRFHVRDLQSRNGTMVNGQTVTETVLVDGDQVVIGPFVLSIAGKGSSAMSGPSTRIVMGDGADARISSLRDHASPRIDVAHLTTLNELGQQLLQTADSAERANAICRLLVGPQFHGQWAVIVRVARKTEAPPQLLHEAYGAVAAREPYLSRSVLRRVKETGDAVLASNVGLPSNAEQDVNVSISPNVVSMAAVACPLSLTDEKVDVLYIMLPPRLGSVEWLALVNLAVQQYQQAESVWAARKQAETLAAMEREQVRARQIQMRLVPKDPKFAHLEVAIGFLPCHWVGGDYVDAVKMADGRALLAIADVCGKGLPAALIASSVHTMIHAGVMSQMSLADLMTNLNSYLLSTLTSDTFVTMIAIAVDSNGEMEVVNAGHPPPLLLKPGEPGRRIEVDGNLPLGQERDPIVSHRVTLANDELLMLYSDGLSELPDSEGKLLGINGLSKELQGTFADAQTKSKAAADQLSQRLDALQGSRPAADDRTFLLARRV